LINFTNILKTCFRKTLEFLNMGGLMVSQVTTNNDFDIDEMTKVIENGNINFLVGSGISSKYLSVLGNIEVLLTELKFESRFDDQQKKVIKVSILKKFFDEVIVKNINLLGDCTDPTANTVIDTYIECLRLWIDILLKRRNGLLNKQANIFTSNYDVFFEKAFDQLGVEFNDGFTGRFVQLFKTSNFSKLIFKKSLQYGNIAEIPLFNLFKVHGSLTWCKEGQNVVYSDLSIVKKIQQDFKDLTDLIPIDGSWKKASEIVIDTTKKYSVTTRMQEFLDRYGNLAIINPTKLKFEDSVLDCNFYDLLRIFSNELEKENTALFVFGFSFADEHIAKIVKRAVDSNPTLKVYIFAFDYSAKDEITVNIGSDFKYNNIQVIIPPIGTDRKEKYKLNLENINKNIFSKITKRIGQIGGK